MERRKYDVTLEELAREDERADLSTLSRYETGKSPISADRAAELIDAVRAVALRKIKSDAASIVTRAALLEQDGRAAR